MKKTANAQQGIYCAIGTDGMRPVAWGLGATYEEALADAADQGVEGDDLEVVRITPEMEARIRAGDVGSVGEVELG